MKEINNIFITDFKRSFKMFLTAALVTAIAIPAGIFAGFTVGADLPQGRLAMASLPAFIGIIMYIRACFKLYHTYIFAEKHYFAEFEKISAEKLVLLKVTIGTIWLTVLCLIMALAGGDAVWKILGQGPLGMISAVSILLQGILMITVLYLAATASHIKMFSTYKTLAGIFVLVAAYALETDLILRMKRIGAELFGGTEKMLSGGILEASTRSFSLELAITLIILAANITITAYLLRYKLYEPITDFLLTKEN